MVELDGKVYTINTPTENAAQAVQWVNQYCLDNQIKNRRGEIVSIEVAPGSPLYLILLAASYLITIVQNLIYGLGRVVSLANCTDRQLEVWGELLRIRRKPATYTTIRALVYATEDGDCNIVRALTATIKVGGLTVIFSPLYDITIPADGAKVVVLQASGLGSHFINANSITAFDEAPTNFKSMVTEASLPGRPLESLNAYRKRIQTRPSATSSLDRCIQEIRGLPGIAAANIYYNTTNYTETIHGHNVGPRMALCFIQGYNDRIAEIVYGYLFCDFVSLDVSQSITLLNGQVKTVSWTAPAQVPIYIDIFFRGNSSVELNNRLISATQAISLTTEIAATITAVDVVNICKEYVPEADVTGVRLSKLPPDDPGVQWDQKVSSSSNEIFDFNRNNIRIIL
jgi:hypothetical protein